MSTDISVKLHMDILVQWIAQVAKSSLGPYFSMKNMENKGPCFLLTDISVLKDVGPLKMGDKFKYISLEPSLDGDLYVMAVVYPRDAALYDRLTKQGHEVITSAHGDLFIIVTLFEEFPIRIVSVLRNQKL